MFCPFCGKENSDNVKFCGGCGADISKHGKAKAAPAGKEVKQPKQPKQPKQKKPRDYVKVKKYSFKAVVTSAVCLALSCVMTVSSLAAYFLVPSSELTDEPVTPPEQAVTADPVYDLDFLTKPKVDSVSFGVPATERQLAELKKDVQAVEEAILAAEIEALGAPLSETVTYEPEAPTEEPSEAPTEESTEAPTEEPSEAPTEEPSEAPTEEPSEAPTEEPTEAPTEEPTEAPTEEPSEAPSEEPDESSEPDTPIYTEEEIERCVEFVSEKVRELYYDDKIAYYEAYDEYLVIQFNSGVYYLYIPEIEGFDSGAEGTLKIATYQPCVSGYSKAYSEYVKYPDAAAERIEATFPMYAFDGDAQDYNDGEVDANTLFTMPEYNVILWHGHGGYVSELGSVMTTGIPITEENEKELYSLIADGSLVLSNSNYLVSPVFFEKHVAEGAFDNSIIYLGTCSSGRSDRLARAFLDKGAEAVYANSGIIHTDYNLAMMDAVVDGLCTAHENGTYYNVREALDYARENVGESDTIDRYTKTYVNLYTDDESFSLDWYEDHMTAEREVVLVLDASGSMDGTPMNETKEAAAGFVDSVLDAKAAVSLVTYDSYAEVRMGFTRRATAIKGAIDSIGTGGSTNIYHGLYTAAELLQSSEAKKKIIVLMSDGVPNEGLVDDDLVAYADSLREEGIYIYSLGFFHNLGDYDKAVAQDILRRIADDGSYHDVADAEDVSFVFDDIAEEITGERKIYIRIACPVNVEVTCDGETLSKDNPRTSFGSLAFELPEGNDEDEGYYESEDDVSIEDNEDSVKIVRLKEGLDYDINIEGTGSGKMDYTIGFMGEDGEYDDFREFRNVKIKRSTVISTKANYSDTTTMLVDEDGDGKNDYVYRAEKDSKAEKKEVTMDWRLMLAIIGGIIATVALASLVISVRIFKDSKRRLAEEAPAPVI